MSQVNQPTLGVPTEPQTGKSQSSQSASPNQDPADETALKDGKTPPVDYELLFRASPSPLLVLGPDSPRFTILAVNDKYLEATVRHRANMVGLGLFEVFPDNPEDPTVTGQSDLSISLDRVLRDKVPDVMGVQKYDIRRTDLPEQAYEVRYWSPINIPVMNGAGEVVAILHRVEDITEFMLMQQQKKAADNLHDSREAEVGMLEAEVLQRADEVKVANRRLKALNQAMELRELELSRLNQQLQELDKVKTDFFSNVSHEFRTPLTLMMGPIEDVLKSAETGQEQKALLDIAYRNVLRLFKLVNNLLDFARIEAGRIQASYQPTNLSQLTRELTSMFSSATDKAKLELVVDCPPLPEPVYVDRDMWEKIVLNLLSNAFKHTFAGKIEVRLRWLGDHVELSVSDTGVGIPQAQLPLLFERFHRVPNAKSRTHEGSGIGLALVNELVKLHSGVIQVNSVVDQGTEFTVTVPTGKAHLPPDHVQEMPMESQASAGGIPFVLEAARWVPEEEAGSQDSEVQSASSFAEGLGEEVWRKPDGQRVHILLADDNIDMRNYVCRLLKPHCDVVVVGDGEAALAEARRNSPDLILTDVMMPRMDGMALLAELRKDPALKMVSVILLSARAGEEARVEGLQAGADDYLVKPFGVKELLARVKANLNLELHRAREQAEEAQAESEERFKTLFNQAATGIAQADLDGKFLLVNQRYCEMLGRTQEELRHLHVQDLTLSEDLPASQLQFKHCLETGEPYVLEKRCIRADGSLIWVRNHVSLIRDRHGHPHSMVAVSLDITERMQAELAIRKAQLDLKKYAGKLERSNKELEHFAMIASHDLQEPLRKVMMFSDHLLSITENQLSMEAQDDIERLRRSTQRMQMLIDNLLDLSRVTRKGQPFKLLRLADVMTEIMADLHPLIRQVQGRVDIGNLVELEADPIQIQQLLENLLSNALKFHRPDKPPVVEISSEYIDANYCQITVKDNGIGIKPEYQEKIYDAFVRLNSQSAYPGTGIGLTICRKIVERHEGTIQLESVPDQGSTFTVKLPIRQEV